MPEGIEPRPEPWLAARLDALVPPPLPADFAARVLEAAEAHQQVLTPRPAQRPGMPRWRSAGRRARIGGLAAGLVLAGLGSVSAAAAGYFGAPVSHAVHRLPVVGPVIERVIPEKPRHRIEAAARPVKHREPARPAPESTADPAPQPAPLAVTPPLAPPDPERIAARIAARRERMGLPPLPPQKLERRARVQAAARADRMAAAAGDPGAERRVERRERIRADRAAAAAGDPRAIRRMERRAAFMADIRAARAGDPEAQARVERRRAIMRQRREWLATPPANAPLAPSPVPPQGP